MTEVPGESVKQRVRRLSAELFATHGYHATGVQAISEAVGLGRGALYYHIVSKEQLLYEIAISQVQSMRSRAQTIADSDATVPEKLRALARSLISNLVEHRAEWTVATRDGGALAPELRAEVLAARDGYEEIWGQVLHDGVEEVGLRPVDMVDIKGILNLFNGTYLWFRADGRFSTDEIADRYLDMVLNGIRATPATAALASAGVAGTAEVS
jgi:AcrR family transcriptional regulator